MALFALGATTASTTRPSPMPPASSLAAAEKQVDEMTRSAGPFASADGAARLLQSARATTGDMALHYAAGLRAMDLSAAARNTQVATDALTELRDTFDLDIAKLQTRLVTRLANAKAPNAAATLTIRYLDEALAAGRIEDARQFTTLLRNLRTDVRTELHNPIDAAMEDEAYARRLGPSPIFNCLYANTWPDNLAAVGQSSSPFSAAAQADIAASDTPSRLQAAQTWWDLGQSQAGVTQWRIQRRTIQIYESILPKVDGLHRQLLLTRMAGHQRGGLAQQGCLPGLLRDSWSDNSPLTTRIPATQPVLSRDNDDAAIPRKDGHVRFHGVLLVDVPGVYELVFIGGSSLDVSLDGKRIVSNPKASRKRSGEKVAVQFASGLHPIIIEVASSSSRPHIEVNWKTPLSPEAISIPAAVFFHDGALDP